MSTTPKPSDAAIFDRIRYWKDSRSSAAHLFPTNDSLRWFLRCHDKALRESGAVLKLAKGTFIDPESFRTVALPLMQLGRASC